MTDNIKILDSHSQVKYCNNCNPKKYLTFNFSYISHENPKNPTHKMLLSYGNE